MSGRTVRLVNVVPVTKIKKEPSADEEDPVRCKVCAKGFASEVALNNHARIEHIDEDLSGEDLCARPVKRTKEPSDDEEDPVRCKVCAKGFASEVALNNHARIEHIDEYLSGEDMCMRPVKRKRQTLTKEQELAMEIKKQEVLSSMEPADLTTLASKEVDYILIKAEDEPEVKKRKTTNKKEVKTKTTKPNRQNSRASPQPITGPFECTMPSNHAPEGPCHQIFLSCCEYSLHHRDEHTRRRKSFRCQVCEKPLAGGEMEAPFPCLICGVGFQTSKDLSAHNETAHVKLKPFQCGECKKRFTQQGGLQQHMRMHTGERPYGCTYCPKAFTQKSGLEQHLRIHTKIRPYKCVICEKDFCQFVHLQQHMRTHTNVAPFECGICQKRFKQSSHLFYHLKNHNPFNMTEEQKLKYFDLLGMMSKTFVEVDINGQPQVTVSEPKEVVETEQSQVPEAMETYVFEENGDAVWCETVETQ